MNIFIGFVVLLFVVVSLGINSNVLSLNIVSAYGIIIETPFENNYQNNANNNSSDNDLLVFDYLSSLYTKEQKEKENKFVILMFDRGYQSIFSTAKPIMDKFGFKASIFIACDYIEKGNGMSWNQVRQLYNDGYDIQSHGLEHTRLTELKSENEIQSVISGGKECLQDNGFSPTAFQAPYNKGGEDPFIVDTIANNFDFAFTGHSELMFLNCDGWENFGYDEENYHGTTDCRPYFSDGNPTPTNKFAMKEWSHDRAHDDINNEMNQDPHGIDVSYSLYLEFVRIVNSQTKFNEPGKINAIPIVGYHEVSKDDDIGTSPELFYLEMEYLYDNGFKVITIDDLGYDKYQERFYVKNVNTLGSEYSQLQDTTPTWTETIRTQTMAKGSEYSQLQDTNPTWFKPNTIQSLDIID
ncbi:MAG TPA: polysaccharide deacetylase family protein [Nitrososphaeraceae archaeon]|nr:polysaccharide deacetylase family protein [Nitrososphaeraceae archaeon]